MCQRYRHLMAAGKAKVVVITAIAREMAGFLWAIARASTTAEAGRSYQGRHPTHSDAQGWGRNTGRGTLVACYGPAVSMPDP